MKNLRLKKADGNREGKRKGNEMIQFLNLSVPVLAELRRNTVQAGNLSGNEARESTCGAKSKEPRKSGYEADSRGGQFNFTTFITHYLIGYGLPLATLALFALMAWNGFKNVG